MFEMKEYVSIFQRNGVKEAEHYRMDNAPKKIYKFIPFFDNGNSKVNKRNIETIEEKKVWASKYFSLNDPFEFNGMYLDEEKISASGNDVGAFYEYWKYITDCFITTSMLGHLPMIFDAKWQNFCVRKIPMPMPVQAQGS